MGSVIPRDKLKKVQNMKKLPTIDNNIRQGGKLFEDTLGAGQLQKLKEQQAKMGTEVPPHILTEIEDLESEISAWR